jgi:hypothetical protein
MQMGNSALRSAGISIGARMPPDVLENPVLENQGLKNPTSLGMEELGPLAMDRRTKYGGTHGSLIVHPFTSVRGFVGAPPSTKRSS